MSSGYYRYPTIGWDDYIYSEGNDDKISFSLIVGYETAGIETFYNKSFYFRNEIRYTPWLYLDLTNGDRIMFDNLEVTFANIVYKF